MDDNRVTVFLVVLVAGKEHSRILAQLGTLHHALHYDRNVHSAPFLEEMDCYPAHRELAYRIRHNPTGIFEVKVPK